MDFMDLWKEPKSIKSGCFRLTRNGNRKHCDPYNAVRLNSIREMNVELMEQWDTITAAPSMVRNLSLISLICVMELCVMEPESKLFKAIHCYDAQNSEFFRLIGSRDFLNSHPDVAKKYKENFIQSVYALLDL